MAPRGGLVGVLDVERRVQISDGVPSQRPRSYDSFAAASPETNRYASLAGMSENGKIAKNLERFVQAVAAHDRENPTHTAWGIGLSHFDIERLGFEEGEEIIPGIKIQTDGGVSGNFRVLCDGQHDEGIEQTEEEVVHAVSTRQVPVAPVPYETP